MTVPFGGVFLAVCFAAISAAAFICAVFYPAITRSTVAGKRSAVFDALMKGRPENSVMATRSVRRAQEAALKSVVQHGKASRRSQLEAQITAAGLNCSPRYFIAGCFILGVAMFQVTESAGFQMSQSIMLASFTAWLGPRRYLASRANQRRLRFLSAFSPAVDMIVRGAKSGLSLMDCLTIVANDAADPVRQEFELIVAQLRAGVSLPAAMERLGAAMPAPEVRFFVMIMSAQSQTGGNLSEALSNLSGVLRNREKIAAKIRIASAEGRVSALIIGALPFVVIGTTTAFAPDYISFLWNEEAGRRIAAFCTIWLIVGIFALYRMAQVEV